ncbi:MAG: cytochrome c biogenesis protein CcdA [Pseudomonadota bacterium]
MFDVVGFQDAAFSVQLMIALAAGIVSFLSPCVLPIVPPYLAFMAGSSLDELTGEAPDTAAKRRVVLSAGFFVLGLSTVFLMMGAAAGAAGLAIAAYQQEMLYVAGAIVILFGLHFLGIIRIPFLFREARFDAGNRGGSPVGAYILGLAFAFGWTPCIGPILGAVLGIAAQGADVGTGTTLLAVYAIGLGVPFFAAALFLGTFLRIMRPFRAHLGKVERGMGVFLVLIGVLIMTNGFAWISYTLLETFPTLAVIG